MATAVSDYDDQSNLAGRRIGVERAGMSALDDGDSGGPRDDMNEARLKRIEERLHHIETEQRTHLRWLIVFFVTLMILGFTGIGYVTIRVDRTEDKLARVDERIGRLETSVAELPGKISGSLAQLNQTLLQAILSVKGERPVIVIPDGQTSSPTVPPSTPQR